MCIIISTCLDNPVKCRSPHVSLQADNRSSCVLRQFMGPSASRLLPLVCVVNVGGKEAAWHSWAAARHAAVPSLPHFLLNFHAPLRFTTHSISSTPRCGYQRIPFFPPPFHLHFSLFTVPYLSIAAMADLFMHFRDFPINDG